MTQDADPNPFSNIPLHLLHAELTRRQDAGERPACGSDSGTGARNYNTSLHVFALFLILALSTFACSFPIVVRRFPNLPVPNYSLFLSRHFGTGVLIATAFVHLLPTAYLNLTDPCLPAFWNVTYPPMAGFITMVSMLVVVGIEMVFAAKGAGHSHDMAFIDQGTEESRLGLDGRRLSMDPRRSASFRTAKHIPMGSLSGQGDYAALQVRGKSPYSDTPGSVDKPLPPPPPTDAEEGRDDFEDGENDEGSDLDLDELDPEVADTQPLTGSHAPSRQSSLNRTSHVRPKPRSRNVSFASPIASSIPATSPRGPSPAPTQSQAEDQRLVLQCLLLEAGILFHSIFIGMALSVSVGTAFIVFLIAISFHQTFEGLALGARIAAIPSFKTESMTPWLMSLMYGITTPVGQAIGLAVHTLYDPASEFGLLMVGIVNGISAGLLIYAGLVQLLAEDFLSDRSYVDLKGRRRVEACLAVACGCLLMSIVGAFA